MSCHNYLFKVGIKVTAYLCAAYGQKTKEKARHFAAARGKFSGLTDGMALQDYCPTVKHLSVNRLLGRKALVSMCIRIWTAHLIASSVHPADSASRSWSLLCSPNNCAGTRFAVVA